MHVRMASAVSEMKHENKLQAEHPAACRILAKAPVIAVAVHVKAVPALKVQSGVPGASQAATAAYTTDQRPQHREGTETDDVPQDQLEGLPGLPPIRNARFLCPLLAFLAISAAEVQKFVPFKAIWM